MSRWYVASNYTPADDQSIQACPNPGAYTDLDDGDKCFVHNNGQTDFFVYDSSSSTAQNIPHVITPDGNAGNGRWLKKDFSTHGNNGFDTKLGPQSDTLATIGVSGTTFTLTYVADYSYYVDGAKYTVTSGNKTVEITDVEGLHWIYLDNTGTLQIQAPGGTTDDLILNNCLVAAVYWDATNNQAILLFDERHGHEMAPITHYHLHETLGAKWESGLALSGFDLSGDGTAATHAQFDLGSGEFHDEDNEIEIAADTNATIDTFYRLGVGGNWRKLTAGAGYPVAAPQTGTRMDWNDYNGGTWQLAEVANNDFVLTHYFATNDKLGGGVIGIMGQGDYANIIAARTGADTELNSLLLGTLPVPEILPIATVIWKTTNGSSNAVAGAIFPVTGGGSYVDWRTQELTGSGVPVGDHESLAGLLGGAAADHYHLTQAQHDTLTDGSDADALHDHDGISENTTHRTGDGSDHADVAANTALSHTQNTDTKIEQLNSSVEVADAGAGTITMTVDAAPNMDINVSGTRFGATGARINAVLDQDDMSADSDAALATQQSIKAYVRDNAGDPALPKLDF